MQGAVRRVHSFFCFILQAQQYHQCSRLSISFDKKLVKSIVRCNNDSTTVAGPVYFKVMNDLKNWLEKGLHFKNIP